MKRQPWVQPQGQVEFDERNPLTTGLLWAMVGDHAIGAGAEPRPDVGSTDAYYGAGHGHQGKHLGNSGTTGSRPFTFHSRNVIARMGKTDKWTVYVIRRTTDTVDQNDAGIWGVSFLDGVWGPPWGIADLRKNAGNDGFRFTNAYGSGSAWLTSTVGDPPWFDSEWHSIALRRDGANYGIFKNGSLRDTVTGTAGAQASLSASDDDVYVLGYGYSASQSQCGEVAFMAIWDRTLSDAELKALEQDPYQVLRPAVPMPTFKPAAASGATTGTAAGTSTASGVGAATAASTGSSAGTGAASGVGASTVATTGSAAGTGAANGVGASTAATAGSAAGVATVSGVGQGLSGAGDGAAAGTSTATGVGASTVAATGTAAGSSTALGVSFVPAAEVEAIQGGWGHRRGDEWDVRSEDDRRRITDEARREAVRRAFDALDPEVRPGPVPKKIERRIAAKAKEIAPEVDLSRAKATLAALRVQIDAVWQERQTELARMRDDEEALIALLMAA